MKYRKHIELFQTISILLFSLLANYIFSLKFDFEMDFNWIAIIKLICLSISTFSLYFITLQILIISEKNAIDEFDNETDLIKRAEKPINQRFGENLKNEKLKYNLSIIVSIICAILFFLIEPTYKYFFEPIIS